MSPLPRADRAESDRLVESEHIDPTAGCDHEAVRGAITDDHPEAAPSSARLDQPAERRHGRVDVAGTDLWLGLGPERLSDDLVVERRARFGQQQSQQ